MHHQIEAVLEGTIVDGSGESVVDQGDQLVLAGKLHHLVQVEHLHERIGDGLHVDRSGRGGEPGGPALGPAQVD